MRWIELIAAVTLTASAGFAEPGARAYVNRATVSLGHPFLLNVEASGNNVGDPRVPDVDGLNINKRAAQSSSSTRIEIVGGNTSMVRTQVFGYYVQATRTGRITIPPIAVPIDGQTVQTQPIVLNVMSYPQTTPQAPQNPAVPQGSSDAPTWQDAVMAESNVSKREVYQGEGLVLTLSVWRMTRPADIGLTLSQNLKYPSTEGFYAVSLEPTRSQKERNGYGYDVTEYRQMLYPTTASGTLTIGSWHWEGTGEYGFFQRQPFTFDTPPITVTVKPLPERPPNFSGAVGTFAIKTQLARTQLVQGVPVQLVVSITGQGNPDAIQAPPPAKIEKMTVSDPETDVKSPGGALNAVEKDFKYAITPLEPGNFQIPGIAFCYFDPVAGDYKTDQTQPIDIIVTASAEAPSPGMISAGGPAEQRRVDVIGKDIVPIITQATRLRPSSQSPVLPVAVGGLPVLAYGSLAAFMRRKRLFERDSGYARDYAAKSKGQKRLRNVTAAEEPSEDLYKAVIGFIADKFNVAEAGMTCGDARQLLEARGIDGELIESFTKILRACERARYASVRLSADEVNALAEAAAPAMDRLEAALKRGRRK